jgi:hypothetical protein
MPYDGGHKSQPSPSRRQVVNHIHIMIIIYLLN